MVKKAEAAALAPFLAKKMKRDYFGEDNAATADDLVEYLGLSNDRDLRDVIKYVRAVLRHPIISTFSGGICYATGWDDDAYDHCKAQRVSIIRANADAISELDWAMERVYGPPRLFTPADDIEMEVAR